MLSKGVLYSLVSALLACVVFLGCFNTQVPEEYSQGVARLRNELEKLEKIPLDKTAVESKTSPGAYAGIIDYKKRSQYLEKNRWTWLEIAKSLDDSIASGKLDNWRDDALFCKAYLLLTFASLDTSSDSTDAAISSLTDFISLKGDSEIEPWTRRQLKTVLWDRMDLWFSESISEKMNLDAFFHIGIANLLVRRGTQLRRAVVEYQKVLEIDPKGVLGCQARQQMESLKRRLNAEVGGSDHN